ncbi:hypothetical protein BDW66DRAFT_141833 [Aspergillus desertorum]
MRLITSGVMLNALALSEPPHTNLNVEGCPKSQMSWSDADFARVVRCAVRYSNVKVVKLQGADADVNSVAKDAAAEAIEGASLAKVDLRCDWA